jgi:hypothetical protein
LADPQTPLIGAARLCAVQAAAAPPLMPEQAHVHGPSPLTALAIPCEHKLALGAESNSVLEAMPQAASALAACAE